MVDLALGPVSARGRSFFAPAGPPGASERRTGKPGQVRVRGRFVRACGNGMAY